ncbi:MAG: TldD/PmbA family protein [Hyphomicrobiales bacterium]
MSKTDIAGPDLQQLTDAANALMSKALKAGADAADVVISRSSSTGASARLGVIENTSQSENDSLSLRVFCGKRVASVASKAGRIAADGNALVERAVAMAASAPEDEFSGLIDSSDIAGSWPELDLFDTTDIDPDELANDAIALEEIARDNEGITNSNGASASFGMGGMVLAASNGFSGAYLGTRHSRSVSVVAGEGTGMERDYDYDSRSHLSDLRGLEDIAKSAAERTLARMNPRKVETQQVAVLFDQRISTSFLGHLSSAINGASIARGSSFLKERLGELVFRSDVNIVDDPHLTRKAGSRPFDADGTSEGQLQLVENGILKTWLLDSYSARELGLASNGRAAFSGSGTRPATSNFWMEAGKTTRADMIASMDRGLIVTDFIGHGANIVTGDYSRGVSGFWVENGEVVYPVSEMTLAGSLPDIFAGLVPADDLEFVGAVNAPSLYIEGLTLAGR